MHYKIFKNRLDTKFTISVSTINSINRKKESLLYIDRYKNIIQIYNIYKDIYHFDLFYLFILDLK